MTEETMVEESPAKAGNRTVILAAVLVLAAVAAYVPVFTAGFIWDDNDFLTDNPLIRSPQGLSDFWLTTKAPDYFPLTSSMLWLEWRLWGMNATGYHIVNILLHACSALLLWQVLKRLGVPGAWVGGLIFAVHPVCVESVAWITERKNTLPMALCLLSFLWYLRSDQEPKAHPRLYLLSLFAFVLSMLAKTSVAALPMVLLGSAWWLHGRIRWGDLLRTLPFFAVSAALSAVTVFFQYNRAIADEVVREDGMLSRLVTAGWAVWFYLYKALVPVNLSFVYPRWSVDVHSAMSYVPLAAAVVAAVVIWLYRKRWSRALAFSLGCYVVMLLPVLGFFNIFFMRYSLVADHWQYFSIPAIAGLAGATACWVYRRVQTPWRQVALAVGVLTAVSLGGLTLMQTMTYLNTDALWADVLEKNPDCWLAWDHVGNAQASQGKIVEARESFRRALSIEPRQHEGHFSLGRALSIPPRTDIPEAIKEYQEALRIKPKYPDALSRLAWIRATDTNLLNRDGKEAVALAQKACELTSNQDAFAVLTLAAAYAEDGQYEQAAQAADRAASLCVDRGDADTGSLYSLMADQFRSGKPYRETPAGP